MSKSKKTAGMRYGMRFLIGIITLAAIAFALVAKPIARVRKERRLIRHVIELGGSVDSGAFLWRQNLAQIIAQNLYGHTPSEMTLKLDGCKVSDADLLEITQFERVRELSLNGTRITDESLKCLHKLKHLRTLSLDNTSVTDDGIRGFAKSASLASLSTTGTSVSYDCLRELDKALPFAHFAEQRAVAELKPSGMQISDVPRWINVETDDGLGDTIVAGVEVHEIIVGMNRKLLVTDKMIRDLSHVDSVGSLHVHSVTFDKEGLTSLSHMVSLQFAAFYDVNLKDSDIPHIARISSITELELSGCDELKGITLDLSLIHI